MYDRAEGDDVGLLFRIILDSISGRGFLSRCGGERPPKAATDPKKFHALYAAQFVQMYAAPFHAMDVRQRHDRLYDFLKTKWSTDKKRRCMMPATDADWCRCEASWGDFFIRDEELRAVCDEVVASYASLRHA